MLGFGMCGCGGFIERAVLPLMRDLETAAPVAVFDTNTDRMEAVSREFGIKQKCASFEELLEADGVDVVYVATPNVFHKAQTMAAARAGKHVFCQKPLALNAHDCREMIAACRENGVKLGVGFCNRFVGAQQKAKQLIEEGAIGEVSHIHFSFSLGGLNRENAGWRCDPKLSGGGPLMDLCPHMIDLGCFFLEDRVESVMGYVHPDVTDEDVETDVIAILKFSKGATMSIDTSFIRGNIHNYTVVGVGGQIYAQFPFPWLTEGRKKVRLVLQAGGKEQDLDYPVHEHIQMEMREFCRALEAGREPPVPGEAGLRAQAAIDAIYQSDRTGRRCAVAD